MTDGISKMISVIGKNSPLVHMIVGQVSVNDCANVVLAAGARPITSECTAEVCEIVSAADALAVSFANINEMRAKAIMLSGHAAMEKGIPSVIDVVGVTCSSYRRKLAMDFIRECKPAVIKGNISEIKMLWQMLDEAGSGADVVSGDKKENVVSGDDEIKADIKRFDNIDNVDNADNAGIDASPTDVKAYSDEEGLKELGELVWGCAKKTGAVILASGKKDIVSDGFEVIYVEGGRPEMARVTGTGCMLNSLVATFLTGAGAQEVGAQVVAVQNDSADLSCGRKGAWTYFEATVNAARAMKLCGERADIEAGLGSYHINLINEVSKLAKTWE